MKIHCPELPKNLKEETEWAGLEAWAREEEADISGCRLTGITEPGADLSRLTFRGVRWERCRLNEAEACLLYTSYPTFVKKWDTR